MNVIFDYLLYPVSEISPIGDLGVAYMLVPVPLSVTIGNAGARGGN